MTPLGRGRRIAVAMLFVYGASIALIATARAVHQVPDGAVLMSDRESETQRALTTISAGGPPLLSSRTGAGGVGVVPIGPVGPGDDQGIYLFVPLAGQLSGLTDVRVILKWLIIGLFAPLFILYPWLFLRAFRSWAAAIVAPLALLSCLDLAVGSADVYWSSVWSLALALPLTLLLWDAGPLRVGAWPLVLLIAVTASFATSIRTQAGLPALLGLVLAICVAARSWPVRAMLLGIAFAGYVTVEPLAISAIQSYRDRAAGVDFAAGYSTSHLFWHNAYIGLGYLPNPYGLAWDDLVGARAAESAAPGVRYRSIEYEKVIEGLYIDILRKDPGFVVDNVTTKLEVALRDAIAQFGLVLLMLPLALGLRRWQPTMQRVLSLALLAVPSSLAPAVLTVPLPQYELGWLGVWALLLVFCAAWAGACVAQLAPGVVAVVTSIPFSGRPMTQRETLRGLLRRRPSISLRWTVAAAVCSGAVFSVGLATKHHAEVAELPQQYRAGASPLVARADKPPAGGPVWSFSARLPPDWQLSPGVTVTPADGALVVATNALPFTYQLWSSDLTVNAGSHEFIVDGRIESGGAYLGVLDLASNTWLVTTYYWYGQDFSRDLMAAPFRTAAPMRVRLVLSNWAPFGGSSTWRVSEAELAQLPR